ncbi:hypothetical protein ACIP5Y_25045 [Nocardia sp. NPDC088792]|uniref:hypothetical protein n=1 Tax=Nocardia sp. NPDC088792 TaxID=3364332 RepID=UPI00382C89E1
MTTNATCAEIFGRISHLARIIDRELSDFFRAQGLQRWEYEVLSTLRRSGNESGLSAGALYKAALRTSGAKSPTASTD